MQDDRRPAPAPDLEPPSSSSEPSAQPRLDSISQGGHGPDDDRGYARRPSIGIRRLPSLQAIASNTQALQSNIEEDGDRTRPDDVESSGRRRSHSAPQRFVPNSNATDALTAPQRVATRPTHMPDVAEESSPSTASQGEAVPIRSLENVQTAPHDNPISVSGRPRARTNVDNRNSRAIKSIPDDYEYGLVDFLDTVGRWSSDVY